MGDGSHVFFDTVSPAIVISNSEVGGGALSIETGVYTEVCTNLAMIGTNLRKYHTGARAAVSDEVYALLTDDTKRATDTAVWKQVRDLVKSAFAANEVATAAPRCLPRHSPTQDGGNGAPSPEATIRSACLADGREHRGSSCMRWRIA